ncbi:MAG: Gfo/Idh/MocA family oxidoreductase, partial [Bacteriovoracaceae bacterium]|nr:Gfo/Idh/MocA family oxidoreductase [Bacteriovoracaceae bacterium]
NQISNHGVNCYKSYQDLLLQEDLDVLFVCLTNDIAAEVTMAGLEKKLHVFCEKPPARTVEEVKKVRDVESTHRLLKLKYGFNHRYHDSVKEALRVIESGELGAILNMRGVYGKSIIVSYESDWRSKREIAGGGILLDQGIHLVDLMRLFAGDFDEYYSFIQNSFWNYDVEDNAYALMKNQKGIVAFLHSTATEWRHRFNLEINLTNGTLILGGILSGSKSYGQETLKIIYRGDNDGGNPREQLTTYIKDNSWKEEIDEFADSIVNNGVIRHGSSLDALKTMEMVFEIYFADKNWCQKFNIRK